MLRLFAHAASRMRKPRACSACPCTRQPRTWKNTCFFEKERRTTTLVFVPQGFVALVYEDGALRTVIEAGVGVVARAANVQVQFVNLQPEEEMEVPATLQ